MGRKLAYGTFGESFFFEIVKLREIVVKYLMETIVVSFRRIHFLYNYGAFLMILLGVLIKVVEHFWILNIFFI